MATCHQYPPLASWLWGHGAGGQDAVTNCSACGHGSSTFGHNGVPNTAWPSVDVSHYVSGCPKIFQLFLMFLGRFWVSTFWEEYLAFPKRTDRPCLTVITSMITALVLLKNWMRLTTKNWLTRIISLPVKPTYLGAPQCSDEFHISYGWGCHATPVLQASQTCSRNRVFVRVSWHIHHYSPFVTSVEQ